MDKRSSDEWNGERVKVIEPVTEEIKTVRLVLQKALNLKVFGSVTGKEYFFPGAGSVLDVDERDVSELLQKGANRRSCCGGSPPSPYFSVLGG